MTLSSDSRKTTPYVTNGVTTAFPFTFRVLQESDVKVYKTDTNTGIVTVLSNGYTVSLNAGGANGGTVTINPALAAGYTITVAREVDYLQNDYDPTSGSAYYADVLEQAIDKRVMQIQQIKETQDRTLKLPITATGISTDLPVPVVGTVLGSTDGASYENISLTDSGQAIAGNWTVNTFIDGVNMTAGVTTSVAISKAPASAQSVLVTFDGVVQHYSTYSVAGTTLTFSSAIPAGVSQCEVRIPTTLAVGSPADGAVVSNCVSSATMGDGSSRSLKDIAGDVNDFRKHSNGFIAVNMQDTGYEPTGEVEWFGTSGQMRMKLVARSLSDYLEIAMCQNNGTGEANRRTYGGYFKIKENTSDLSWVSRYNGGEATSMVIHAQYRHFGIGSNLTPGYINGTRLGDCKLHVNSDPLNLNARIVVDGYNTASITLNNNSNSAGTKLLNFAWTGLKYNVERWDDTFSTMATLHSINCADGRFTYLGAYCDGSKTLVVATNGGSATMGDAQRTIILDPAAGIATFTLTLPASPLDGQIITVVGGKNAITSLSLSHPGKFITSGGTFSFPAGGFASWVYHAANTTWYRCG